MKDGVAPRATMSVAEVGTACRIRALNRSWQTQSGGHGCENFGALDGSKAEDSSTTVVILPGTSVADASLAVMQHDYC